VVVSTLPSEEVVWQRARDSINIVMGGILGGFLGLTISRQGLQQGTYTDLFALITLNAFAVIQIIEGASRYFERAFWLSLFFLVSSIGSIAIVMLAASRLGIDDWVVGTIYLSWMFMIAAQIFSYEAAAMLKSRKK
jgi:hypothetical protein